MNAFLNVQNQLENLFTMQLAQHNFEQLCLTHIEYFKQHQQQQFSYHQFCNATARCHAPITSHEHLLHYITLYGYAHFQRFSYLIQQALNQGMLLNQGKVLRITDYGCGQGIATLACLELLNDQLQNFETIEIVLIEPSELAITRAKNWITAKLKQQAKIKITVTAHTCSFNDMQLPETSEPIDGVALHLFSNVLDVYSSDRFNMQHLAKLTHINFKHQYFLAISPDYYSGNLGFTAFLQHLKSKNILLQQRTSIDITEYHTYNKRLQTRTTPIHALVCYHAVEEII